MKTDLEPLAALRYPGRAIVIGRDVSDKNGIVIYVITGRSPSSQARRLEDEENIVWTRPTDVETLEGGRPELLVYPALIIQREGVAVSNGRQTPDIARASLALSGPEELLSRALQTWTYEPDAPIFTPRISGFLSADGRAALSIIRRDEKGGQAVRETFALQLGAGKGFFLSTYEGGDRDPILPFGGAPRQVNLREEDAARAGESVYRSLRPPPGEKDYRVAVASLFLKIGETTPPDLHIVNRHGTRRRSDG